MPSMKSTMGQGSFTLLLDAYVSIRFMLVWLLLYLACGLYVVIDVIYVGCHGWSSLC